MAEMDKISYQLKDRQFLQLHVAGRSSGERSMQRRTQAVMVENNHA